MPIWIHDCYFCLSQDLMSIKVPFRNSVSSLMGRKDGSKIVRGAHPEPRRFTFLVRSDCLLRKGMTR
jgi:hypothetical protein